MFDPVFQTLVQCLSRGDACALATVVDVRGSTPRKPGARMLVLASGETVGTVGGGSLEVAVIEEARAMVGRVGARLFSYNLGKDLKMKCGGRAQVFVESFCQRRLMLFGAGHVGHALFPLIQQLGFRVTVVDGRAGLASEERFPGAVSLVHSFDAQQWSDPPPDEHTYAVVATMDHDTDTAVVLKLLEFDLEYLGMIGSKTKRRALEKAANAAGVEPSRLARLHTPMGLTIGAETPAEIAVSIAGELVQTMRCNEDNTLKSKE